MSQNRIIFEVIAEGKNLKVVQRDVESLAQGVTKTNQAREKAGTSQRDYNRREKAIYQGNLASAKSFSKLSESIAGSGSSALVNAYATLAANLFAATAAFNALKSASEAQQVRKGLDFIGNTLGINLKAVANELVTITGHAITLEEAMRAVALGTKAGFNIDQLKDLAFVARGASTALGRDLADSFDRLIRGVAKLEPEILDELGLVVRIEEATEKYALALGKTSKELTSRQRIQAFANETIEQGLKAYGAIANTIEVEPYAKLLASLNSLGKALATFINDSLGLGAFANYLSENMTALAGAVAVFVSTISKQMLPVLYQLPVRTAKVAQEVAAGAAKAASDSVGALPQSVGKIIGSEIKNKILEEVADEADFKSAIDKVKVAINRDQTRLADPNQKGKFAIAKSLENRQEALVKLNQALAQNELATSKVTMANSLMSLSQGSVVKGLGQGIAGLALYSKSLETAGSRVVMLRTAMMSLGLAARAAATLFLRFLPLIGIILTLLPYLDELRQKFFPKSETEKNQEAMNSFFDTIRENLSHFDDAVIQFGVNYKEEGFEQTAASIKLLSGMLNSLNSESNRIYVEVRRKYLMLAEEAKTAAAKSLQELIDLTKQHKPDDFIYTLQAGLESLFPTLNKILEFAGIWEKIFGIKTARQISEQIQQINKFRLEQTDNAVKAQQQGNKEIAQGIQLSTEEFINSIQNTVVATTTAGSKILTKLRDTQNSLNGLIDKGAITDEDITSVRASIQDLTGEWNALNDRYTSASESIRQFEAALFDLNKTSDTELTPVIKAARAVAEVFNKGEFKDPVFLQLMEKLDKQYGDRISKAAKGGNIEQVVQELEAADKFLREVDSDIKGLENIKAIISKIDTHVVGKASIEADIQRDILDLRTQKVEKLGTEIKSGEKLRELDAEAKAIAIERRLLKVSELEVDKERLKIKDEELASLKKTLDLESSLIKLKMATRAEFRIDKKTSKLEEYMLEQKYLKDREIILEREFSIAKEKLEIERDIAKLKMDIIIETAKAEGKVSEQTIKRLEALRTAQNESYNRQIRNLQEDKKVDKEKAKIDRELSLKKFRASRGDNEGSLVGKNLLEYRRFLEDLQLLYISVDGSIKSGSLTKFEGAMLKVAGTITNTRDTFAKLTEDLGPDGEFFNALLTFADTMSSTFVDVVANISDRFKAFEEKSQTCFASIGDAWDAMGWRDKLGVIADGMSGVGAVVGSLADVVKASADRKASAIDSEIAMEQKRDGKSAASVAKIAALEAKKDKVQRKSFEKQKKMRTAEIVINTAAGIARAFADYPFPLSLIPAAIAAAMGVAQLAIVNGSSYQGGAGTAGAGVPSSVSLGERSNKVDVAKKTSGGELAYLQGQKGIGTNANNFRPAFVGAKHRATGGYIVGEQGPELFTPDVPGTITPSNEIKPSQPVNVTFQISAIDASNMKQMLDSQKGNIIDMIRQAANSHGEQFLESVDTMSLAPVRTGFGRLA